MRKSDEAASRIETDSLDFPDWSGMDDSTNRVTVSAAFQLCEQYLVWVPPSRLLERQLEEKCVVEFEL
jgi:hypothetical protein